MARCTSGDDWPNLDDVFLTHDAVRGEEFFAADHQDGVGKNVEVPEKLPDPSPAGKLQLSGWVSQNHFHGSGNLGEAFTPRI